MKAESLKLTNYRNYTTCEVNFTDGLNIICGRNAAGKTNLIESVYYCGLGKSPRTPRDKEIICWGADFAMIRLTMSDRFRKHIIEIYIDAQGKKRAAIDKIPIKRISDLLGVMKIVFFSPDELDIIKLSPVERRRFMDISLSQQKKVYYANLVTYNKIIAHRNKLLKTTRDEKVIKDNLPIWDVQLARVGADITYDRYEYIDKLKLFAAQWQNKLTDGKEKLEIEYESKTPFTQKAEMRERLIKDLSESYDKDIKLQYTTCGSHRDDIKITLNGVDVRKYGSQGQKRSAALAMKLAEVDYFKQETGESPVLILDDVLSELDEQRQKALIEGTKGIQTLLTCTEYQGSKNNMVIVDNGKVLLGEI